jgi:hypothetical protein
MFDHLQMCNAYRVKPKRSESRLEAAVSDEIERLPSSLVRRTGQGVVVTMDGGEMRPASMRWGFHRPFSDAIMSGETLPFAPYAGNLIAEPCESPLKRTTSASLPKTPSTAATTVC